MSSLLQISEAKVHFGGVQAVDGVSIELDSGVLYGLVGPNGSGKSTLLSAISGIVRLTSGTMTFDAHQFQKDSASRIARMGFSRTFQTVRLLSSMTVLENVMVGTDARFFGAHTLSNWLAPWRTRECERKARDAAAEAIDRVGLSGAQYNYPSMLSYGSQRRVEIARAIAGTPSLILLDEPTAGMNREERQGISELLLDLQKQGLTLLLVEHDLPMITNICPYMFVMNFGRLIAQGVPKDVVRLTEVQEAYLGKKVDNAAS